MIYHSNYRVSFYINPETGYNPVRRYLENVHLKDRAKIAKYIEFLRTNKGILDEPYTRHVKGKIRELRIDFGRNRHRIFFFTAINRNIILLHAFTKKTPRTPDHEIQKAETNYNKFLKGNQHEKQANGKF